MKNSDPKSASCRNVNRKWQTVNLKKDDNLEQLASLSLHDTLKGLTNPIPPLSTNPLF